MFINATSKLTANLVPPETTVCKCKLKPADKIINAVTFGYFHYR